MNREDHDKPMLFTPALIGPNWKYYYANLCRYSLMLAYYADDEMARIILPFFLAAWGVVYRLAWLE